MRTIVQFGAGKSAIYIFKYLLSKAEELDIQLKVFDRVIDHLAEYDKHDRFEAIAGDIFDDETRRQLIEESTAVISMLPARFHMIVAKDCITHSKSLFTASYLSDEILQYDEIAKKKDILFLNEIGLDPGIDHMSAKLVIDDIQEKGGKFSSFKSYCGGLVADECDNDWQYKFSWNPRNVILAGQGTAKFLMKGQYKYIPYSHLFTRKDDLQIPGFGSFEAYANRDSLGYRSFYNLDDIETMFRGTIRKPDFMKNWNAFVQLGMTDDSYEMENLQAMTLRDFTNSFLPYSEHLSVEEKFKAYLGIENLTKFENLGLFSQQEIGLEKASPAKVLQSILETEWALESNDRDLVVMQHQFSYELKGSQYLHHSSFGIEGEDQKYTAMAKTVGLPLAICVKRYLEGNINLRGVQIPIHKEIYQPVLKELEEYGVVFKEEITVLDSMV
ncbi:MAG: saccharopine dehydrogenase NADP-binding domain-containing protein [Flavobacteriales bacterium]|jgi:saccharopine dehydrogenase-like NADP-dependent oxidoreductase|nr:saccharopine dehydrogenase NADP-binding domain-containing protein [Flavobacteriales bacterium]